MQESRRKKGDKEEDIEEIVGYGVGGAAYSFGFAEGMKRLSPPLSLPRRHLSVSLFLSQGNHIHSTVDFSPMSLCYLREPMSRCGFFQM